MHFFTPAWLFFFAIIGTSFIIFNPYPKLREKWTGKISEEAKKEVDAYFLRNKGNYLKVSLKIFQYVYPVLSSILMFFLVCPFYTYKAIQHSIGNQILAYFVAGILVINLTYFIGDMIYGFITRDDRRTRNRILGLGFIPDSWNAHVRKVWRYMTWVPLLYPWYLLAVTLFP